MSLGPPGGRPSPGCQLIPYLGNKRSLLPRIKPLFEELVPPSGGARFLDPFAGSGSVARLARSMGYAVYANDWEPYAYALARGWLLYAPDDLEAAFGGDAARVFADWNDMHPEALDKPSPSAGEHAYFSRYYAPRDSDNPVLGRERLFYTAENARFLDRARQRLEDEYPPASEGPALAARDALMGALVLEAATHANTSGVFKAYHRGFGGHSADALGRIKGRMELEVPLVPDGPKAVVGREDAASFSARASVDLAYLDPPYNQHQYGSNYHLLNALVRWDGEVPGMELGPDGNLIDKAGILPRWRETRSPYCVKAKARPALERLLDSVNAKRIVLSWNGEGHVDARGMAELLCGRGRLEIRALEYTAYRGGRQSAARSCSTQEYLYMLETGRPPRALSSVLAELEGLSALDRALRCRYDPERLSSRFAMAKGGPLLDSRGTVLPLDKLGTPGPMAREELLSMDAGERERALSRLLDCACDGAQAQLETLAGMLGRRETRPAARREALRWLRKLAHRKHAADFGAWMVKMRLLAREDALLAKGLGELELLAAKRFGYRSESA